MPKTNSLTTVIIPRLLQGALTLLIFVTVVFVLMRMIGGDPALAFAAPDATAAEIEQLRASMGLDEPIYVQYGIYLRDMITGSFGTSVKVGRAVSDLIWEHTANSLKLAVTAVLFSVVIAIPLGVLAASNRFTGVDSSIRAIAVFAMAAPSFWLSIVLIQIVAVGWGLLPVAGMKGPASYILPGFVLASLLIASIVRLLRSGMLDVLNSEYVKLARLKGVPERQIIWKHALRNAIIPVLGFSSVQIATFISGSVVIEIVFAWPGLGALTYSALTTRDFALIQGTITAAVFFTIVVNLLADIFYSYLDPRIRVS
ncbi:MAG: ABC transporter permease [Trueperaceae bacterium]